MYWYAKVIRNYAVFTGRARRKEYWMFQLVNFLIALAFVLMLIPLFPSPTAGEKPVGFAICLVIFFVYVLLTILPGLAVSVRRLHDADLSGLWVLIAFIPGGGIVLLVFHVLDGTPGPNQYGPNPKAGGRAGYPSPYSPYGSQPMTPYGTQSMTRAAGAGAALPGGQGSLGFCSVCGTSLPAGSRFCPKCGRAAY